MRLVSARSRVLRRRLMLEGGREGRLGGSSRGELEGLAVVSTFALPLRRRVGPQCQRLPDVDRLEVRLGDVRRVGREVSESETLQLRKRTLRSLAAALQVRLEALERRDVVAPLRFGRDAGCRRFAR